MNRLQLDLLESAQSAVEALARDLQRDLITRTTAAHDLAPGAIGAGRLVAVVLVAAHVAARARVHRQAQRGRLAGTPGGRQVHMVARDTGHLVARVDANHVVRAEAAVFAGSGRWQ